MSAAIGFQRALVSNLPFTSNNFAHSQLNSEHILLQQCRAVPGCSLASDRTASSPFTEYYQKKRDWGGSDAVNPYFSIVSKNNNVEEKKVHRDNSDQQRSAEYNDDIALRLPELKEVLRMLKSREVEGRDGDSKGPGKVFLVGTGPGDPELLTLKAYRLLQRADLVLYDRLVSTDILDMVQSGARLLYVGKTSGYHSRTQEEIHELLLAFAEAGATVVRLKGGDPMVFGRGGEEMDFLQERGIRVQIVPGITAASGIAAELGIPLTHRGVANSVRFLTGHSRRGGEDPLYVAAAAADPDSTLVVYMGLATLPGLASKLMENGLSGSTPAVAVERGTTPEQRTVFAELSDLTKAVEDAKLISPTLIFIGRVVALSHLWPISSVITSKSESNGKSALKSTVDLAEPRNRELRGPDPALPSQLHSPCN